MNFKSNIDYLWTRCSFQRLMLHSSKQEIKVLVMVFEGAGNGFCHVPAIRMR